jgi:hypothetical protein
MFDDDQDSENPFLKTRGESARRFYFSNETHRFKLCPKNIKCLEIVKERKGYEFNITCDGCYNSHNKRIKDYPETITETAMRKIEYDCYTNFTKGIGCKCPNPKP